MEFLTFLKDNWETIAGTGILSSIAAFIGGRKSKVLNEKSLELENIEKVRKIEKQLLADMEDQVVKLIKYNDYLEGVVKGVKKQLVKYVDKYGELED